jgi:DNA-binding transcriptional LysR family regulator
MAISRVLPSISLQTRYTRVAETALTLAARELARTGLDAAWIPESLVRQDLATGRLIALPGDFETVMMSLAALRIRGQRTDAEEVAWKAMTEPIGRSADDLSQVREATGSPAKISQGG